MLSASQAKGKTCEAGRAGQCTKKTAPTFNLGYARDTRLMPKVQPYDRRLMTGTPKFLVRGQNRAAGDRACGLSPDAPRPRAVPGRLGADLQRDMPGPMGVAPSVALILPLCRRSTARPATDVFENQIAKVFRLSLSMPFDRPRANGTTALVAIDEALNSAIGPQPDRLRPSGRRRQSGSPAKLRSAVNGCQNRGRRTEPPLISPARTASLNC